MKSVWIIGGGKFGQLAARRLKGKYKLLVVDPDENAMGPDPDIDVRHITRDGVSFLLENLDEASPVEWVIPSLPIHLAFEWCRQKLGEHRLKKVLVDDAILDLLPHPIRGKDRDIYVSHADFICPDNCSEPDAFCTITRQLRKKPMYKLLESLVFQNHVPVVIRSRQIAPGVGGYSPAHLFEFFNHIRSQRGRFLIGTACKCHGVLSGAMI